MLSNLYLFLQMPLVKFFSQIKWDDYGKAMKTKVRWYPTTLDFLSIKFFLTIQGKSINSKLTFAGGHPRP
jgi:hypothetical protein